MQKLDAEFNPCNPQEWKERSSSTEQCPRVCYGTHTSHAYSMHLYKMNVEGKVALLWFWRSPVKVRCRSCFSFGRHDTSSQEHVLRSQRLEQQSPLACDRRLQQHAVTGLTSFSNGAELNGLVDWLTGCGPCHATVAVSYWRGREASSCPVHAAGCLS